MTVRVVGLEDLARKISTLTNDMERKYINVATRAGAKVIEDEVRARAPRSDSPDSGDLARAIDVKATAARPGKFVVLIGVRYMWKSANKRALRLARKAARGMTGESGKYVMPVGQEASSQDPAVYARFVEYGRPGKEGHTHQTADPFIEEAFEDKIEEAVQAVLDSLKEQMSSGALAAAIDKALVK